MSFRVDDEKLLEKYKTIWNKIEDLKISELNALLVYGNRYNIKTRIKYMVIKLILTFVV